VHVDQVDVVEGDGAGGRQIRGGGVFGHRAGGVGGGRGDGRGLVGAGDRDGDALRHRAAMAVGDRDREALARGLALGQIVGGVVGHAVGPANRASLGGGALVHGAHRQAAAERAAVLDDGGGVHVDQVDV